MATDLIDREELAAKFHATTEDIRLRRTTVEERWLRVHDAWSGVQSYSYYASEFQHFIPALRRTIEKQVNRTVSQLMPHHEFYQVFPGAENDPRADVQAASVHRYMDWLLTDRVKIRKVVKQLARTFYLYSRCIAKNTVRVYQYQDPMGRTVKMVWPETRAVDPFNFYVWPETATDLEQASICFEDVVIPYNEYQEYVTIGTADPLKVEDLRAPALPAHVTRRLAKDGLPEPQAVADSGTTGTEAAQHFVHLREIYFRGNEGRWVCGWLVINTAKPTFVRLQVSKYPRPPYRMAVDRELPGQHYTPGMGEDIEPSQVLLNDQFNQGEESRAVASGPPIILDPTRVKRADTFVFGYRRKWYGDPNAVKVLDVPDTSQSALRAAMFTLQYMEGFGPSGLMSGQPPRGTPRGSGAVSQLVTMAGADLVESSKTIEEECLTPSLQDLYDLTVTFVPPEQIIQIPGAEGMAPLITEAKALFGSWYFKWAGASRFQDKQADAQLALGYLQTLSRLAPLLPQQGYKVDWATLTRILWKDILGERRLAQVIQPMSPEEMRQYLGMQILMQRSQGGGGGGSPMGPMPSERALMGGP